MKIYPKTLYDALDHDIPVFRKVVEWSKFKRERRSKALKEALGEEAE